MFFQVMKLIFTGAFTREDELGFRFADDTKDDIEGHVSVERTAAWHEDLNLNLNFKITC